ncbi:LLM class flavin-dependent oxidoreductase [Deinococcus irradiatisoli]|uniref:LLM class flavin-dependent oxidoreductase n=1 Tax=Deinococcus irradiatisoli TaxID=2202254 RepID=A0A2Z3JDP1_9DEIO|nr:LLM class flavin-dependent oxidoreductase [Deinococcus irradiatisoli]AWN23287.1 LLM class flavin-dependent oxidoreductase [Deinococcus irradiatisoli]
MTTSLQSTTARRPFELGLYSFGERTPDAQTGLIVSPEQRIKDLLEEVELADQVGLDIFGLGEHHRPDYLVSTPAVVLAAAAARTRSIRLTSAVTVLGSDDPVRVFQEYAMLDLISGGRAEIMAGRGSFAESFPIFIGGMPHDYDALFAEKLDLLLKLRGQERLSWSGRYRPAMADVGIYPRPVQDALPIWLAVGGTPASAVRAGQLGLPMALAIIGGLPEQFAGFVDLYRASGQQAGNSPADLRLGINSHGYLAATSQAARDEAFPAHAAAMYAIGKERGWSRMTRAQFDASSGPRGAYFVGDPQQVAEKILFQHQIFNHDRFLLQLSVGTLPHAQIMKAIELYGTQVAPLVRDEIARRSAAPQPV